MEKLLTWDEVQRIHDERMAADPKHFRSSCWCCCWDCNEEFDSNLIPFTGTE